MEEISYKVSAKDYLSGLRYWYVRKTLRWHALIYIACAFVISYFIQIPLWHVCISTSIIAAADFGIKWFIVFPSNARKVIKGLPPTYTDTRIKFGNGRLEMDSALGTSNLNWLYGVMNTQEVVLLLVGPKSYFPVPKEAFRDNEQRECFLAVARSLRPLK